MSEQAKTPEDDDGPLVFEDVTPNCEPVTIGQTKYVLLEASAEVVAKYQSAVRRGMRVGKNADTVEFNDSVGEADLILVANCLCLSKDGLAPSRDVSGNPNAVGLPFVKKLPYHVQDRLYKRAKRITRGMEDPKPDDKRTPEQRQADEERALGNSPGGTT